MGNFSTAHKKEADFESRTCHRWDEGMEFKHQQVPRWKKWFSRCCTDPTILYLHVNSKLQKTRCAKSLISRYVFFSSF